MNYTKPRRQCAHNYICKRMSNVEIQVRSKPLTMGLALVESDRLERKDPIFGACVSIVLIFVTSLNGSKKVKKKILVR